MTVLWMFFAVAILLYLGISLALLRGVRRVAPVSSQRNLPRVSVLIAARDEEPNLARCLEALLANDYPTALLEILVIDDRSADGTRRIAEDYARRFRQLRVVSLEHRLDGMSGKASAICQGVDVARGEIILITDADCIPRGGWIRSMVGGFTAAVGMVGGFTLLSDPRTSHLRGFLMSGWHRLGRFFARVQNLDWIYLLSVGAGAAGLGRPVSILGNNYGFRREVYDAVGGYRGLPFSIIEDFALMNAMVKLSGPSTPPNGWSVRFLLEPAATMESQPPLSWRAFLDQRRRWAAGGKEISAFGKMLLGVGLLRHIATILGLFFLRPLLLPIAGITLALFVDFLLLWHATGRLRRREALRYFPFLEAYFFVYSFLLAPAVALPTSVSWKGVHYHWGFDGRVSRVDDSPATKGQAANP